MPQEDASIDPDAYYAHRDRYYRDPQANYASGRERRYDFESRDRPPYDYQDRDPSPRDGERFEREVMHLEPPPQDARPRSVPPHSSIDVYRGRSRSSSASYYDNRSRSCSRRGRSPSPLSRARDAVEDNFTNSTTGLGASVVGAFVGGFVAREASSAAMKHRNKGKSKGHRRTHSADNRSQVVSTILGAVAGGLGANVLAHKAEDAKGQTKRLEHAFERRVDPGDDYDARESRRHYTRDGYDYDSDDYAHDDRQYYDRPTRSRRHHDYDYRP